MSQVPEEFKYTDTHEWVETVEGDSVKIGITDHAQSLLGDIVYVDLPEVGQNVVAGEECGVIESVKAAGDLYAPVTGEVIAVNEALTAKPDLINEDAYHSGWLIQIKVDDMNDIEQLKDATEYQESIAEEA